MAKVSHLKVIKDSFLEGIGYFDTYIRTLEGSILTSKEAGVEEEYIEDLEQQLEVVKQIYEILLSSAGIGSSHSDTLH